MQNKRFRFYILLTGLGFIVVMAAGLFMFVQFRSMILNHSNSVKDLFKEYIEGVNRTTLENMSDFIEKHYHTLQETERHKQEAETDWFLEIADEWDEIANTLLENFTRQELVLHEQESALTGKIIVVLVVSFFIILAIAGCMFWLNNTSVLISMRKKYADERTEIIFNTVPVGCLMFDRDFNIIDCNQEIVKMFELPDKQVFFERFFDLSPEYQPGGKKSAEAVFENKRETFKDGYNRFVWMHQTLSGKPLPCEIIHVVVKYRDEYVVAAYVRDLQEQYALLNDIRTEYERSRIMANWFEGILDTIPFPISVTDKDMNWTFINAATENFLGVSRNDVMGQACSNWNAEICNTDDCGIARLKKGLKNTYFKHNNSSYKVDSEILTDLDDNITGFIEVVQDITELEQTTKRQVEAEGASHAKSAFLAMISHEIRTPMNAIVGITEIQLQKEQLPPDVQEAFNKVYNSSYLLMGIINDILDLSKIESGKMELMPAQYSVASLINDTTHLIAVRYDSKPIDFKLEIDENIPSLLFGDELRIKQILNNLLSNAFKYTNEGEVLLSAVTEPGGEEESAGVTIVFRVSDTGQGMTREQVDNLFAEYTRFNQDTNRIIEGTGLGMNITKHLVQMMGGSISVKSEAGKGSVFTVRLQQGKVGAGVLGSDMAENLQSGMRADKMLKIKYAPLITREYMPYGRVLVVDDVDTNLYVAKGLMAPYGLSVDSASSGFEVIEKIKNGSSYDIIFMDHFMPKMDGMETVKIIRNLGYDRPIIALTANALAGQAEVFLNSGFDGFISKPIDIRHLNAILNKLIRDKYPPGVIEAARRQKDNFRKISGEDIKQLSADVDPQLAGIFAQDAEKAASALEAIHSYNYRRIDDVQAYVVTVHAMKSALANVGETELSGFALRLEQAGRERNTAVLLEETPAFLNELRTVIDKMMQKEDDKGNMPEEGDEEYLHEKLAAIQTACSVYDKKTAKNALAELRQKTWPHPVRKLLDTIATFLLHSDFEEAMDAAKNYRKQE